MHIDYVETNSSWYRDPDTAIELLDRLKRKGLHTLLISMSPFHNEYIPFAKVKGVMVAAQTPYSKLPMPALITDPEKFDHRLR